MQSQLVLTKFGIFILIVHLYINQGTSTDIYNGYNPFTKLRTGRRLNNDNEAATTNSHFFLNDDTLEFSTSKPSAIDHSDDKSKNKLTHFDVLFNQSSFDQSAAATNRPRIRSASNNELNSKPRSSSSVDLERRQNNNPLMDGMYSGLLQLLSGSLKLNRSPGNNQPIINNQILPSNLPQGLLNNPNLKPLLINPNLLNQLPNSVGRLPNGQSSNINAIQNFPNGFIVGPSNRPPSLPLHGFHKQSNRPLINNVNNNLNPSSNLSPQQQFNNQLLSQLIRPGTQFNLTSLPINNILNNMIANNQSIEQILPNNFLNTSSSSKNYIKVEPADVSRLLGLSNSKPVTRNEVMFSSSTPISSSINEDSINSIESIHFPNELFARTSINRTLNDNQILNTKLSNIKPHPSKQIELHHTAKHNSDLFDLVNATVISNNHNRPFNRTQLASSFTTIASSLVDGTVQLNTNQILSSSQNEVENNQPVSTATIWQPFEMFNTNNNLIKPTRSWEGNIPPDIITKPEEASTFDITVSNKMGTNESKIDLSTHNKNIKSTPTLVAGLHESSKEPEVVYGRRQQQSNSNTPLNQDQQQLRPGSVNSVIHPSTTQAIVTSVTLDQQQKPTPSLPSSINESVGRPLVYPVEMDLVKPQIVTKQQPNTVSIITESGGGSVYIDAQQKHFKLKPVQKTTIPAMQIGSTMNVYGNNGDTNYSLGGRNKPGSSLSNSSPINPFSSLSNSLLNSSNNTTNDKPVNRNQARRPTFRPKPSVRIDTCIVGDDSTCGANLNEHCRTEDGISSCHCKPGYGRSTQRGLCIPTTSLAMTLKIDKLGDNKLQFSKNLLNPDSEDFQYLEFESIQAINSLFQNSRLNKLFLGVRVNKFYPAQSKTMLNCTVVLERNNMTRSSSIKKQLQQELSRVISEKNNALGDAPLLVDSIALPRLDDVNECADANLNDCSRNAKCINELGTFSCICKPGFEDRYLLASQMANSNPSALSSNSGNAISSHMSNNYQNKNLVMKLGRVCLGCSPAYCSNRGECSIQNGEKVCKCKGNFMGTRCDLDAEILAVAFGGSLFALIIIIITILCLYIWNQKWKNQQQKMEAMSSGSGQTFSYVNKPATSCFRFGMEERMRGWANTTAFEPTTLQNNASNYNYYVNPEQILVSTSQHVYATPNRDEVVHTPDQLLDDDSNAHFYNNSRRSKSRNCTLAYQPASIYNETEFSTRKALYTPSHLMASRPKYAMY